MSSSEIVMRTMSHGGTVIQSGRIVGSAKDSRAHVDCSGLLFNDSGIIEAVPILCAKNPDAKMSHEAAIGKIDPEKVTYLQSKGLSEMEAISLIIRGFLNIDGNLEILSPEFNKAIQTINQNAHQNM